MYGVNELVVYSTQGVCKVSEIIVQNFNGAPQNYYKLSPINDEKAVIMVPQGNQMVERKLKKILNKDEAMDLISNVSSIESFWIENENVRKKEFAEMIRYGTRLDAIKVLRSINDHLIELRGKNKKLHLCDEQLYREAKTLIFEELCYVLGITTEEAAEIIFNK